MKGVSRITHAEFIKIFKKPIVYIMVFVLALVSLLTLVLQKPNQQPVTLIQFDADNASGCYSIFYGSGDNSKTKFDETFTNTENKQLLYNTIYNRNNKLDSALEKINFSHLALINHDTYTLKPDQNLIEDCNNAFENLLATFNNIDEFSQYPFIYELLNTTNQEGKLLYQCHTIDSKNYYNYIKLKETYETTLKNCTSIETYINHMKTNSYIDLCANLITYGKDLIKNNLYDIHSSIINEKESFINWVISNSQSGQTQEKSSDALEKLNQSLKNFKSKLDMLINNDNLIALSTNTNYKTFSSNYSTVVDFITSRKNSAGQYTQETKRDCAYFLKESNNIENMKLFLDSLYFLNVDSSLIDSFNKTKELVEKDKTTILTSINDLKTETSTKSISEQATNYRELGKIYSDITLQMVLRTINTNLSAEKIQDSKIDGLELTGFNSYENNQNISQNLFQLENNIYSYNLGKNFSFGSTIGHKNSIFDAIYSSLKINTIVIIIFTIMMIASLITNETENGTIKLLLIRPYSRTKVLIGKMLATLFFSFVFLLLSVLISGVAGYFMFGLTDVSQVLVTLNATKTFLISPILLLAIYFGSCLLDIIFYLTLATTISVLFRSYVGAITTSFIVYAGATIVSAFISTSPIYAYLPFTNISLFRYFGGELLTNISSKTALFVATPVQSLQTIYQSVIITAVTAFVLLIISITTFKKRDF